MTNPEFPTGPIVVGVDGSKSSHNALRWARRLGPELGAAIEVVTTWMVPFGWVEDGWIAEFSPAGEAQRTQDEAVTAVFGDSIPTNLSRRTVQAPAHEALIEASKAAQMIIVGSRGHGGFTGMLLGSVSSAVSAHASCPVLVVH